MKKLWITVVTVLSAFIVQSAIADSMRCGTSLISKKNTGKYEVLKKCGEPTERYGNTWVYDVKGKKRKVVKFKDNGQISSVID